MPVTDLTELVDMDPERVDGVKSPASGFPILLMKAVNAKGEVNEKPDIAGAESVLQKLAQLIIAEAQEMAAGCYDEICDIELLTQAAYMIQCFKRREEMGAEMTKAQLETEVTTRAAELGVTIQFPEDASKDTDMPETKNDTQTPAAPEPQDTPDAKVEKSAAELVQEHVAKAVEPLQEVIKGLRDEMAALKSTPIPGGPVVTVPGAQRNTAAKAHLAAEAARFRQLAKDVTDQDLVNFYETKAAEAEKAANA